MNTEARPKEYEMTGKLTVDCLRFKVLLPLGRGKGAYSYLIEQGERHLIVK